MNYLVKLLSLDDGEPVPRDEQRWHFQTKGGGSPMLLCTGEVFGFGEGGATFKQKTSARGGITCPECLRIIKEIKAVKL